MESLGLIWGCSGRDRVVWPWLRQILFVREVPVFGMVPWFGMVPGFGVGARLQTGSAGAWVGMTGSSSAWVGLAGSANLNAKLMEIG